MQHFIGIVISIQMFIIHGTSQELSHNMETWGASGIATLITIALLCIEGVWGIRKRLRLSEFGFILCIFIVGIPFWRIDNNQVAPDRKEVLHVISNLIQPIFHTLYICNISHFNNLGFS